MPMTQATISTQMGSSRSRMRPLGLADSLAASARLFMPEKMSPFSFALRSCFAIGPYSRPVSARKIIMMMVSMA